MIKREKLGKAALNVLLSFNFSIISLVALLAVSKDIKSYSQFIVLSPGNLTFYFHSSILIFTLCCICVIIAETRIFLFKYKERKIINYILLILFLFMILSMFNVYFAADNCVKNTTGYHIDMKIFSLIYGGQNRTADMQRNIDNWNFTNINQSDKLKVNYI